ncbi:hypothetical protein D3C81_1524540 [compost metagenome]
MKIQFLQDSYMVKCAFHHSFRSWIAVFLKQMVLKRARIYPDTDRNTTFLTGFYYSLDLFPAANIPRINPNFINAVLDRLKCKLIIEMDICN